MRTRTGWLVGILTAGIALAPSPGWGQGIGPADHPILPLPLYHDRPEKGGFYTVGEFLTWRQTNPLKQQVVAVRGLLDVNGSIQAARNQFGPLVVNPATGQVVRGIIDPFTGIVITVPAIDPNTGQPLIDPVTGQQVRVPVQAPEPVPGRFFGSGNTALDVSQLTGPSSFEPGFGVAFGWRFSSGFTLEFSWRHLNQVRYNAVASVVPANFNIGRNGEDQFLFSPVFNFPPEFSGPVNKLSITDPVSVGSSNAALQVIPSNLFTVGFPGVVTGGILIPTSFLINQQASQLASIPVPQSAYGIWNAATIMSIDFVQRYDEFDLVGRFPLYQDDCSRWYGLCGLRHVAMWEQFKWRTVSVSTINAQFTAALTAPTITNSTFAANGNITGATSAGGTISVGTQSTIVAPAFAGADDVALYTNIVSNRMYGPVIGVGSEWYLGWGLALSVDLRAAVHVDVVKERARYEREDKAIAHKRSRSEYVIVPELDAFTNVWWYPFEGVEVRFGYDILNFFNTVSSPRPIDFNYGAVAPAWENGTYRFIEGFNVGVGLIF